MAELDRAEALAHAQAVAEAMTGVPSYLDLGTQTDPTPSLALMQTVFQVNRQNFLSTLAALQTDHVVVAAQLARSLLEESIRWEWMTDDGPARMPLLLGNLYDNLRKIDAECRGIGADPGPFLEPSPVWRVGATDYSQKRPTTPGVEQMLREIEAGWREHTANRPGLADLFQFRALYAQYRVLCQFTHTSVLGMVATVQIAPDGQLSVGQSLSDPVWALVVHCATASAFNVAKYTVGSYPDDLDATGWTAAVLDPVARLAELLGPVHGLHT